MTKRLLEVTHEANTAVLSQILDPTQYALIIPARVGINAGLCVAFGQVALTMSVNGTMAGGDVAQLLFQSTAAGISVATGVTAVMTWQSWRFVRQMSTVRHEHYDEEPEQWEEPERPKFMPDLPSLAQVSKNHYARINHDLRRRELLVLQRLAQSSERFPTNKVLVGAGFPNNGDRFTAIRTEFRTKGLVDGNNNWTAIGKRWLDDELNTPPTPH
jgi:hypothetical protein